MVERGGEVGTHNTHKIKTEHRSFFNSFATMSIAQTCAPRLAKAMLMARPKPWAAPVTIAVLPVKTKFMLRESRFRLARPPYGKK